MNREKIKLYIESLFPCQVGFVKPRIFDELKTNLEYSIEQGYDSGLVHESPEERINPFLIMEDVKTIIVVIHPYEHQDDVLRQKRHTMCRSSWGDDYHLVIRDNLKQVTDYIETELGGKTQVLVDNHMLHDRHLAYLAGLGNYGKNTLMINEKYGTYFFISSILTNIELDGHFDQPRFEDVCGSCTKCLRACPTNAISEERFIHSKRCLAYITQSKDTIPTELIGKLSKFTFGCDFCQLACPYNKNIETDIFYRFKPAGKEIINVKKLYNISNRVFKQQYGDLAGAFRGKNVLLRNALVISANTNNQDDLDVLHEIEDHGNDYLIQAIDYAKNKIKGE